MSDGRNRVAELEAEVDWRTHQISQQRDVIVRQQAEIERLKAVLHGREHWCDCDACRKSLEGKDD